VADNPPTAECQSARLSSEVRKLAEENRQMQVQLKELQAALTNLQLDSKAAAERQIPPPLDVDSRKLPKRK
jgi:regulator of replication initiation timing